MGILKNIGLYKLFTSKDSMDIVEGLVLIDMEDERENNNDEGFEDFEVDDDDDEFDD